MGQMRFLLPRPDRLTPEALSTAHLRGHDDLPWLCRVDLKGNELTLERAETESGTFHILWPVEGIGTLLLSTATLKERPQPYHLGLELARGTINRLRNQLAAWQMGGIEIPGPVRQQLRESLQKFVAAATNQADPQACDEFAEQATIDALSAAQAASASFIESAQQQRLQSKSRVIPLFAGRLGASVPSGDVAAAYLEAFNTAIVPFSWSQIESDEGRRDWSLYDAQIQWCQAAGVRVCGGPLLELSRSALPDWLFLWEGDFENLLAVAGDHVRAVVQRYRGKTSFWNVAGRLMTGEAMGLDDEQKLRLIVRAIEVVRTVDRQTPVIVTFDQPWAEFMARQESDLTPMYFADALVRADLGVAGIGLEMTIGYEGHCTLPRDWIEFGRHLDRWSLFGMPLLLTLAIPSKPSTRRHISQNEWLPSYINAALARPAVQGIFWNQLLDAEASDFPTTGLVEASGQLKPTFAALARIRKKFS